MQPGPGGLNELIILQTAQGLLRYSEESLGNQLFTRGVVIGYDGRYNSKRYIFIIIIYHILINFLILSYSMPKHRPIKTVCKAY